jgi:hypothetical protein
VPRFEYLVAICVYETNWAKIRDLPSETRPDLTRRTVWYIYRPGATEAEEREGEGLLISSLFNEFGQDGWGLVASEIPDSVVATGDRWGWPEAGFPIRTRYFFMREAGS